MHNVTHWARDVCASHHTIKDKIDTDLQRSGVDLASYQHRKVVLNFMGEGQCISDLQQILSYYDRSHGSGNYCVLVSAVDPAWETRPPIYAFTNHMVNHGNFLSNINRHPPGPNTDIDKKFLCLIRRASPGRASFASAMRKMLSSGHLRMSFGSHHHAMELAEYQSQFEEPLPILLDGVIDTINIDKIYDVNNTWYQSLFNVIVETSSQEDPGIYRSIFITEKTFKSFAMCQIPIWFAVPGLVAEVRKMGFDLFDDIVDHSYDQNLSQSHRMDEILQQLLKLDQQWTLVQCQQQRKLLWPRLMYNYNLLFEIEQQHQQQVQSRIDTFANQG